MGSLVLALAVADGFDCLARFAARWAIDRGINSTWCQLQAFMIQEFSPASANICLLMSLTMVYIVHFNGSAKTLELMQPYLIVLCFIVALPLALTILVYSPTSISNNLVGDADSYCWISADHKQYRIWFLYLEVWAVFVGAIIAYGATWLRITGLMKQLNLPNRNPIKGLIRMSVTSTVAQPQSEKYQTVLVRRMMLFVIAFMVIWTPATVNRIHQFVTGDYVFTLGVIQAICNSLGGFINCIIFILCCQGRSQSTFIASPSLSGSHGNSANTMSLSPTKSLDGSGRMANGYYSSPPLRESISTIDGHTPPSVLPAAHVSYGEPIQLANTYSNTSSTSGLIILSDDSWTHKDSNPA
ncbi:hypothetical protein BATDEDRAFT_90385 [Batrachochytrium dendrobatidis JAM81]|uniref:G-protein coupled receptors family 1 profile domain-containing protein n=2 Tax=Batrachochytrium dendrobatidis TaxID=109871 RepID=F4P7M7_BATDJ|nr:uncharacterized protein BATDEDRAFT_90385 [Batrachochytrium dendrobatidis JAM81]EGF78632.1 hypothetical protein BATDEDRAFT_90385 [Batrachochytrium dendrobatidis JAM81]|eukprot:XP_006680918.1 hypothetical protein BATDEDRAFT_90385 [Batrachochytrium dendrobatidis JAM81]